ncbi:condensation domain-containing protein [Carboxylicivirga sp. RSCT41]|uniref:condensation domain-containing protein n=1 Tax=Carboxylicivirga agarovorans TaxID=3417570 RepID=UPI003D32C852
MINPLSYVQQQFFLNSVVYPKDSSYNIPLVYKVKGDLNPDLLEKALNLLIDKYDVLRSSFIRKGREFSRIVHSNEECVYKIDTPELPYDFEGVEVKDVDDEVHELFDLGRWPLFRVKLFKFKDNVSILSIVFHHIIIDLHSYTIFAKELSTFYNLLKNGDKPIVEEVKHHYNDFVEWEAKWLKSNEADTRLDFWCRELGNKHHLLNVPAGISRPAMQSKQGKRLHFEVNSQLSYGIKKLAEQLAVTPFTLLLTAYSILLSRLSGQKQVIIGVPLSNRRKDFNKQVFGPLINILPIIINDADADQKIDLIREVRLAMLKAHRNQELPFLHIVNSLNLKKSFAYSPIFQVGFAYEPKIDMSFDKVDVHPLIIERRGAQLDLFLTYWEQGDTIQACLEFSSDLYTESSIREWIEMYKGILKELL